ncbi:hypothetical protein [Amycolatopsis sp. YIM 10]|uniref:hypothetical protein n=1 Tax=Amycolatopsis sp. YIM 10 TaxID=2653857 RepID=UPI0012901D8C|nr:hypothetical protein [Amycolatopsis sp. YIM 10]QFU86730.1 hypothetical protein YIM_07595 [Amycolatopsis sp. YIM 10]
MTTTPAQPTTSADDTDLDEQLGTLEELHEVLDDAEQNLNLFANGQGVSAGRDAVTALDKAARDLTALVTTLTDLVDAAARDDEA